MPCILPPTLAEFPKNSLTGQESGISRKVEKVTGVQAALALSSLTIRTAGIKRLFVRSDIHQTGVMSVQRTIWDVTQTSPGEFVAYGWMGHWAYCTCKLELACVSQGVQFIQNSPDAAHTWQGSSIRDFPAPWLTACEQQDSNTKFLSRISHLQDFVDHQTKSQTSIAHPLIRLFLVPLSSSALYGNRGSLCGTPQRGLGPSARVRMAQDDPTSFAFCHVLVEYLAA